MKRWGKADNRDPWNTFKFGDKKEDEEPAKETERE